MELRRRDLEAAARRGIIAPAQAEALWSDLAAAGAARAPPPPPLPLWRPLAAALATAVLAALSVTAAFDRLGFGGLAAAAAALSLALLAAGWQRWRASGGERGEVLLCAAVLLVPLAAHGTVRLLELGRTPHGLPPTLADWLAGPWFPVQAATALAAGLVRRAFRIPFLSGVLGAVAWFAAQDAAPILFGPPPSWSQRAFLSSLAGVVLLAAGLAVDRRARRDHAFWLYLPGLAAFSGGLVTWQLSSDLSVALVAALHLLLVGAALLLERPLFAAAGALGAAAGAGRLADDLLDGRVLAFVLAGLALLLVGLGLLYQARSGAAAAWLAPRLPRWVRRLLPPGVAATLD